MKRAQLAGRLRPRPAVRLDVLDDIPELEVTCAEEPDLLVQHGFREVVGAHKGDRLFRNLVPLGKDPAEWESGAAFARSTPKSIKPDPTHVARQAP
jgi:hypothetical protein